MGEDLVKFATRGNGPFQAHHSKRVTLDFLSSEVESRLGLVLTASHPVT